MAEISSFTQPVSATTQLPSITIGKSDFPMIRRRGTLFVDKTAKLPWLLEYNCVFFARPRRFGKSTLVSMLFELFRHGTEMFKGLAVYDTWPEKRCYPTIMISLYGLDQPETFEAMLCGKLAVALKDAGLRDLYDRTKYITQLIDFFGEVGADLAALNTVWLIDEWDFPLAANLDRRKAFDANDNVLRELFVQLRLLRNVHYLFVTGIMRYQPSSLFSGQDIINISMEPDFADLMGYTQAEVETNFAPYIARAAEMLGLSRAAFLEQLKLQYGGFCFDSEASVSLYCPWSINRFFQQCASPNQDLDFKPFWMNIATASQALHSFLQARRADLKLLDQALRSELEVSAQDFDAPAAFEQLNLPALMVQSGYLTLKKNVTPGSPSYRAWYACGFPNLEVAAPFVEVAFAVAMSAQMGQSHFEQVEAELSRAVRALDMAAMAHALNALLVCIYYDVGATLTEGHYHTFISLSLRAAHLPCAVPVMSDSNHERTDIEFASAGKLLVIELKQLPAAGASQTACLAVAQEAQDQVLGRKYSQNFDAMQRPPYKERNAVVLVISELYQQIVYWRLLALDKVEPDPLLDEGWVEPVPLECEDADAYPVSAGESSADDSVSAASQMKAKANPALDMTDLDITFEVAQHLGVDSEHAVTLDPDLLALGIQSYAARLSKQKGTCSQEQINDYVERYIDKLQKVALSEKARTFDRSFLVQELVALLTKVR